MIMLTADRTDAKYVHWVAEQGEKVLSKSEKVLYPCIASSSSAGLMSKVILLPMHESATDFGASRLVSRQ